MIEFLEELSLEYDKKLTIIEINGPSSRMVESQFVISWLNVLDFLVNATISVRSQFNDLFILDEVTVNISIANLDFGFWDPSFDTVFGREDAPIALARRI